MLDGAVQRRDGKFGTCCICGWTGKLSFEHVPPRSAFNDRGVLESDIHRLIQVDLLEELKDPRGRQNQRGAGRHSLCERCNSLTGTWYADAYVDFAQQAYGMARIFPRGRSSFAIFRIKPLNVFKQLVAMFCSACDPGFVDCHPGIRRYLLNKEARDIGQPPFSVYMGLYDPLQSAALRQAGITGRLSLDQELCVYSEIAFPPFVAALVVSGPNPDPRLLRIDFFRRYDYDQVAELSFQLWALPVVTYFPADYRPQEEIVSGLPATD